MEVIVLTDVSATSLALRPLHCVCCVVALGKYSVLH